MSGYGDTVGRGGSGHGQAFDMSFYAKHINLIVKFQALFRGHLARRNTAFIMKSKRVSFINYSTFLYFIVLILITLT